MFLCKFPFPINGSRKRRQLRHQTYTHIYGRHIQKLDTKKCGAETMGDLICIKIKIRRYDGDDNNNRHDKRRPRRQKQFTAYVYSIANASSSKFRLGQYFPPQCFRTIKIEFIVLHLRIGNIVAPSGVDPNDDVSGAFSFDDVDEGWSVTTITAVGLCAPIQSISVHTKINIIFLL